MVASNSDSVHNQTSTTARDVSAVPLCVIDIMLPFVTAERCALYLLLVQFYQFDLDSIETDNGILEKESLGREFYRMENKRSSQIDFDKEWGKLRN